jgi:cell cycle protein kinase DBF2
MDQVTSHPFFEKTDWTNLRGATPPFVPSLDSEIDTGYYDDFTSLDDMAKYAEVKEKQRNVARVTEDDGALKNRGVWVGFTFGKNAMTRDAKAVLADASAEEDDDTRLATIF